MKLFYLSFCQLSSRVQNSQESLKSTQKGKTFLSLFSLLFDFPVNCLHNIRSANKVIRREVVGRKVVKETFMKSSIRRRDDDDGEFCRKSLWESLQLFTILNFCFHTKSMPLRLWLNLTPNAIFNFVYFLLLLTQLVFVFILMTPRASEAGNFFFLCFHSDFFM